MGSPTAEQIGLIGTNWSKGWVIENNTIQYSTCSGITLGKHGDEFDNTKDYRRAILIAVEKFGWNRENIGRHLIRNNHIQHCGQAGIVGSLGARSRRFAAMKSTRFGKTMNTVGVKQLASSCTAPWTP